MPAVFFTTDLASLVRTLHLKEDVKLFTSGESSGPMGIDKYSEQESKNLGDSFGCLFTLPENGTGPLSIRVMIHRVCFPFKER